MASRTPGKAVAHPKGTGSPYSSLAFWVTTAIIGFVLVFGGVGDLIRPAELAAGMRHLGYPDYVMTLLGIWKLLGAGVLLAPRLPRLKEWAYAGAVIDFTGAVFSHVACGDDARHIITPLLFTVLTLVSWATRPAARRL